MKRFMKVCGISAAVLFALGLITVITVGIIRGPQVFNEVKEATGGTIVSISGVGKLLDRVGIRVDLEPEETVTNGEVNENDIDKQNLGHDFASLTLDLGGCEMYTRESKDNNFYVSVERNYKFSSEVKHNTLYIKEECRPNFTGKSPKVTLYVPEGYQFEELSLYLGAGSVECKELYAKTVSIDLGAGSVEVKDMKTESMSVNIGAGGVELKDAKVEEMAVNVGAGSFDYNGEIGRKAELEVSMGAVCLKLDGDEEDFNYDIEASLATVTVGNHDYMGSKKIDNAAKKDILASCSMGAVEIRF